jgi:predicted GIY-YIG superfamily endonuclease
MYFVYVIQSVRHEYRLYIGVTSNLFRRLREHNSPLNKGYTHNDRWRILYVEGYLRRDIAYDRERKFKQYGNAWHAVRDRVFTRYRKLSVV